MIPQEVIDIAEKISIEAFDSVEYYERFIDLAWEIREDFRKQFENMYKPK